MNPNTARISLATKDIENFENTDEIQPPGYLIPVMQSARISQESKSEREFKSLSPVPSHDGVESSKGAKQETFPSL